MSETNKKTTQEVEVEATEKKPAVKKVTKSEKTEKKEGLLKRFGNGCKRHKEAIITGVVAFIGGAFSTVGAGIVMNKRREKKQQQSQPVYIPEPEVSPLDPNIE